MGETAKKKAAKANKKAKKRVFREGRMPYLGNDPYFVKKAEEAKEALRKSGIKLEP
jgi:hypothetical protein